MPRAGSIAELRVNLEIGLPFLNANPPEVARVMVGVPVSAGVHAEVIVPAGSPPFPTLVYLHGGGWSIGSAATHHKLARQLAVGAGVVVVNVDYRLAPEHPFPRPLEDCVVAARWSRAHVAEFGGDGERIAIGGDSAGGNLSVAVVNELRGEIEFRGALLLYGAFDLDRSWRDYDRWVPEEDPVLPKHSMRLMLDAYLSGGTSSGDPRVSPELADLRHFPPACLVCGTWDPLLGESIALHEKLRAADRITELHRYPEMPHAFMQLPVSEGDQALATACAFLQRVLRATV
jgi:acetyl esterase